jgi:hypothetical protein
MAIVAWVRGLQDVGVSFLGVGDTGQHETWACMFLLKNAVVCRDEFPNNDGYRLCKEIAMPEDTVEVTAVSMKRIQALTACSMPGVANIMSSARPVVSLKSIIE